MKVTIEKQLTSTVTETVDVEPGYYKNRLIDCFYKLCESGTLIHVNSCAIYILRPDRTSYTSYIKEIVNEYAPCDQSEFEAAKDKILGHLSHYVKFPEMTANVNPLAESPAIHTMEPNQKQREEVSNDVQQATEQQNAVESAAQDQAVEVDSEEGSIEG